MPMTCLVLGCGSRHGRDKVKFYSVPEVRNSRYFHDLNELSRKRRVAWITALKRANLTASILRCGRICSRHFISGLPAKLHESDHPDWVPSQNMDHTSNGILRRRLAYKKAVDQKDRIEETSKFIPSCTVVSMEPDKMNGDHHPTYLYDPDVLKGLDWKSVQNAVTPFITNEDPGEDYFLVRPLQLDDYERGYLQLLSQLTTVGDISKAEFEAQFLKMQKAGCYFVTVIEDIRDSRIIGSATLVTELKFIHKCAERARLEDVVVNNTYRGKQLGKLIVLTVTLLAKKLGCYKMSLDCKDQLIPFYKSLGYTSEPGNSNTMMLRYESKL